MVKVREDYSISGDGEVDIDRCVQHIAEQTHLEDPDQLRRACEKAAQIAVQAFREDRLWAPGASSFRTGLEMAQVLAELHLDQASLVAAVLYRAVREERVPLEEVRKEFGDEVAGLINGVQQMAAISSIHHPLKGNVLGQSEGQLDNVRKMLVTMIDDVRVALIKLAERTCAIRAVKDAPEEKRMRVAREVFDIYAPLAHRLGIGHIKWELEDLSFRYLHGSAYKKIAKLLDEKRLDRESYIRRVIDTLQTELKASGIKAELSGRAKHIYSIWRKMRRKGIDFSQVYDVRAVRILVPEVRDCYGALGIVHTLWRHIPNEFDDYIANPKENGYQSLHTAVIGPEGKVMEVQIRTHAMHEEAELGVCAHWLYKGTDTRNKSTGYDAKINWLRQVLEWQEELGDISGLADHLKSDVASDRVYVFTPEGHVVDLPQGATPVDFAYRVHTEIGHACRGARVNSRIVPLTYPLKTGDQVFILTSNNPAPSRDWLNPSLGYIQTSRARAKVTHWFKQQNRDRNVIDGRAILEDEFKRLSLFDVELEQLAAKVNYHSIDDMFAAIGAGDLRPTHVANVAQQLLEPRSEQLDLKLTPNRKKPYDTESDIQILGVGKLKTQVAKCCKPLPGDPIGGYITVGRGVTVHRQDCLTFLNLREFEPNRIIEVNWGGQPAAVYPVDIEIEAYDRSGLLRDITQVLSSSRSDVLSLNTVTNKDENTATMRVTVEISSLEQLARLLAQIRNLPNIIDVRRKRG
ncbi:MULTISPECIES: GTP diphosphokinase [Marinobacter]|jgi:GTP pyrophosphokinase|uniref:GTP pyrophosphokinase n=1 Tax=Marinobacter nauticus TaxID=2743 RepID=A0A368Y973_MARNT|nr:MULTISPECIES: GTP diphosphokinase [Marinobacter]MEC8896883.1 GTP diphosphokinase [Pseudomonadota bacterium]MBW3198590.1 GTP diphosphokinase [Marinobacter nauticus]MBY6184000.1 GTP diphosphokinase [Marinobacter nauticus]MCC4272431.1 GTP diphosphokinase [Marinobacter nauticus]MEC9388142.1 GTP diphosphokinase [Pseudomonadota bacterium]